MMKTILTPALFLLCLAAATAQISIDSTSDASGRVCFSFGSFAAQTLPGDSVRLAVVVGLDPVTPYATFAAEDTAISACFGGLPSGSYHALAMLDRSGVPVELAVGAFTINPMVHVRTIARGPNSITYRVTASASGNLTVNGASDSPDVPFHLCTPAYRQLLMAVHDTVEMVGLTDSVPYLMGFTLVTV